MRIILSLDGGGCKGITTSTILRDIELTLGIPLCKAVDLIVSTSVGAAEGGILATGLLNAFSLHERMKDLMPELFHWRWRVPLLQPKYSRDPFRNMYDQYIPTGTRMSQCKTKYLCTSVNIVDALPHFFKSWESKDGNLCLRDAIERSFAAPMYFGAIRDPANNAVWTDGGTGCMNNPVEYAFIEAKRQGWFPKENVHVLSLGCGHSYHGVPFRKADHYRNIRQVYFYMQPEDGGLARIQVSGTYVEQMKTLASAIPTFSFQRIDTGSLLPEMDVMDGVKYIPDYVSIGEELARTVDYAPFHRK